MPYKEFLAPERWAHLRPWTAPLCGLRSWLSYKQQLRRIRKACPATRQGRRKAWRQLMKLNEKFWNIYWEKHYGKGARVHG